MKIDNGKSNSNGSKITNGRLKMVLNKTSTRVNEHKKKQISYGIKVLLVTIVIEDHVESKTSKGTEDF